MNEPTIFDVKARVSKTLVRYEKADLEIQTLVSSFRPEDTARARRKVLSDVQAVMVQLGAKRESAVSGLVKFAYIRGVHLVAARDKLTPVDVQKVQALRDNLYAMLLDAERVVVRNVQDVSRKMTLLSIAQTGGGALASTLQATGFVDRSGSRWKLSDYARMAIRTVAYEALTEGSLSAMQNHGYDIITVNRKETGPLNPACAPWDGKSFSISGESPTHDKLTAVPPFHPSCEHFLYREQV